MSTLSPETLLKLAKRCVALLMRDAVWWETDARRRTWFLERVLKLGLAQIAKEYECVRVTLSSSKGLNSDMQTTAVRNVPGPIQLRAPGRRKVASSLPSRLPLRALPTQHGLPLPPLSRRRIPTSHPNTPLMPNDRQSLRRYLVRSDVLIGREG